MNNKCCNENKKSHAAPTSHNYSENVKNREHEKSPYGKNEPSHHTDHK